MILMTTSSSIMQPSLLSFSPSKQLASRNYAFLRSRDESFSFALPLRDSNKIIGLGDLKRSPALGRNFQHVCFYKAKEDQESSPPEKDFGLDWPILERWEVPWKWQTVILTMIACGLSFVLTGLLETSVAPYLSLQSADLSLDEKSEILFVDQFIVTAIVLGVVYGVTNSFKPLQDDIFCYSVKDPFNLKNGWLLWAGGCFLGAVLAIALTGVGLSLFNGDNPQREDRSSGKKIGNAKMIDGLYHFDDDFFRNKKAEGLVYEQIMF